MKEIPLTLGKTALVDDEDYERVSAFVWRARKAPQRKDLWYAYRITGRKDRTHPIVEWLHHFILGSNIQTDHRDSNGLNNRRENLRPCSSSENACNRRLAVNNTTGFKGVSRKQERFSATIKHHGKQKWIGVFSNREDAAKAYDSEAVKLFGEFARLNFPIPSHPIGARL